MAAQNSQPVVVEAEQPNPPPKDPQPVGNNGKGQSARIKKTRRRGVKKEAGEKVAPIMQLKKAGQLHVYEDAVQIPISTLAIPWIINESFTVHKLNMQKGDLVYYDDNKIEALTKRSLLRVTLAQVQSTLKKSASVELPKGHRNFVSAYPGYSIPNERGGMHTVACRLEDIGMYSQNLAILAKYVGCIGNVIDGSDVVGYPCSPMDVDEWKEFDPDAKWELMSHFLVPISFMNQELISTMVRRALIPSWVENLYHEENSPNDQHTLKENIAIAFGSMDYHMVMRFFKAVTKASGPEAVSSIEITPVGSKSQFVTLSSDNEDAWSWVKMDEIDFLFGMVAAYGSFSDHKFGIRGAVKRFRVEGAKRRRELTMQSLIWSSG